MYLFENNNKVRSEAELNKIKNPLHIACREGNLDLIMTYLDETVENYSKSLRFKIDEFDAILFELCNFKNISIPTNIILFEEGSKYFQAVLR